MSCMDWRKMTVILEVPFIFPFWDRVKVISAPTEPFFFYCMFQAHCQWWKRDPLQISWKTNVIIIRHQGVVFGIEHGPYVSHLP